MLLRQHLDLLLEVLRYFLVTVGPVLVTTELVLAEKHRGIGLIVRNGRHLRLIPLDTAWGLLCEGASYHLMRRLPCSILLSTR